MKAVTSDYKCEMIEGDGAQWTVGKLVDKLSGLNQSAPVYVCIDGVNLFPLCDGLLCASEDVAIIGTVRDMEYRHFA